MASTKHIRLIQKLLLSDNNHSDIDKNCHGILENIPSTQFHTYSDKPVWSIGHRNPQGLARHHETGDLWSTEHGPSGNDGPGGGGEVNLIIKGENYGWPKVSHERSAPQLQSPKQLFTPAVAPASATFYNSQLIPQLKNNLFFGALGGNAVVRLVLSEDSKSIPSLEKLDLITDVGGVRDVAVGPAGKLFTFPAPIAMVVEIQTLTMTRFSY